MCVSDSSPRSSVPDGLARIAQVLHLERLTDPTVVAFQCPVTHSKSPQPFTIRVWIPRSQSARPICSVQHSQHLKSQKQSARCYTRNFSSKESAHFSLSVIQITWMKPFWLDGFLNNDCCQTHCAMRGGRCKKVAHQAPSGQERQRGRACALPS